MKTLTELKEEKRIRDEIKAEKDKKDKEEAEIRLKKWREQELSKLPAYIEKEILPEIVKALKRNERKVSIYSRLRDEILNEYIVKILNAAGYGAKLRTEWCPPSYNSEMGNMGGYDMYYLDINLNEK